MRILISHSLDWVKANMAEWSKVYGEDWLAIKDEKVIAIYKTQKEAEEACKVTLPINEFSWYYQDISQYDLVCIRWDEKNDIADAILQIKYSEKD
jgi:hypothetical protein